MREQWHSCQGVSPGVLGTRRTDSSCKVSVPSTGWWLTGHVTQWTKLLWILGTGKAWARAQAYAGGPDTAQEAWLVLKGSFGLKMGALKTVCYPVIEGKQGHWLSSDFWPFIVCIISCHSYNNCSPYVSVICSISQRTDDPKCVKLSFCVT